MKHRPQARERQTKARAYWRERDHCGWTGKLTKQEDQKQTHRSTRQISREMGLTQCSIVQIIHRDLVWSVFRLPPRLLGIIVSFSYMYISQGSVATPLRWSGILTNHFIANFSASVHIKEFWKSVNIWQRYGQYRVGRFLRQRRNGIWDLWLKLVVKLVSGAHTL